MNKTIQTTKEDFKVGKFKFGLHGSGTGSAKQIVHDGDTVSVFPFLNFSSRFLGVDAPEQSFTLPSNANKFVKIEHPDWQDFLKDRNWENTQLPNKLRQHLSNRLKGHDIALNHARHEKAATQRLEELVEADRVESGKTKEDFVFFTAFAHEILDSYGRLLCYLSPDEDNFSPKQRKQSYNERLLAEGLVTPYFIFPNVQPFIKGNPFAASSLSPVSFWDKIRNARKLQAARSAVRVARLAQVGIFNPNDPLILQPFELRFLGRGSSQNRYAIDLSKDDGTNHKVVKPENYFEIPNIEDRLFIPAEYLPLFRENGWRLR